MFQAYLPEIERLQDAKARAVQTYRAEHGGADPFEDRAAEILSRVALTGS